MHTKTLTHTVGVLGLNARPLEARWICLYWYLHVCRLDTYSTVHTHTHTHTQHTHHAETLGHELIAEDACVVEHEHLFNCHGGHFSKEDAALQKLFAL